jgi:hypothetical protein
LGRPGGANHHLDLGRAVFGSAKLLSSVEAFRPEDRRVVGLSGARGVSQASEIISERLTSSPPARMPGEARPRGLELVQAGWWTHLSLSNGLQQRFSNGSLMAQSIGLAYPDGLLWVPRVMVRALTRGRVLHAVPRGASLSAICGRPPVAKE